MTRFLINFFTKLSYVSFFNKVLVLFLKRISAKYSFVQALDENDFAQLYRLRYRVYYREFNLLKPKTHEGFEQDPWDKYSIHLVAKKTKRVIGTVRLILDSEKNFRVEEYVNLPLVDRNSIAEVSRLVVDKDYRGNHKEILWGLLKKLYDVSNTLKIRYWCGTMFIHTWKLFVDMGLHFNIIGEVDYWPKGSKHRVAPFFIEVKKAKVVLEVKNPLLYSFICDEAPRKKDNIPIANELLVQAENDSNFVKSFIREG